MGTIAVNRRHRIAFQEGAFLEQEIAQLQTHFASHYNLQQLKFSKGHVGGGYATLFVEFNGITHGKIVFQEGDVHNIKHYKPHEQPFDENDPGEILFLLIKCFYTQRCVPSKDELNRIIRNAKEVQRKAYQAMKDHRDVEYHRRRLYGKNLRSCINDLLLQGTLSCTAEAAYI